MNPVDDIHTAISYFHEHGSKIAEMRITVEKFNELLKLTNCKNKLEFFRLYRSKYPDDEKFKIVLVH
ncbi:MAG: hypothetical protein M0Q91_11880 [Methanoregula sp.]|nr:hypothetical protein [Methanoregula sp.]